jgi:predicted acylesterase/phospholipase RssA/CRP-like cAMP-binding protein
MRESDSHATTQAARLRSADLFRAFDDATLDELAGELEPVHLPAGAILFRQGDARDAMYIIVSGRLVVTLRDPSGSEVAVNERGPGQTVGETGLIAGGPRSNTARALEDADLLRLSTAGFGRLCEKYPEAMAQVAQTIAPQMRETLLSGVLADLLGELDAASLHAIQAELEWKIVPRGEVLAREGEFADCMYLVVYGHLRVATQDAAGKERVVDAVGRGDIIGEMGLLTGQPLTATIYAVRDSAVAVISRAAYQGLQAQYPDVTTRITRIAFHRMQRQAAAPDAFHTAEAVSVVVVPASPGLPQADLAQRLADALAEFGTTVHLSSERLDAYLDRPGIAQLPVGHPAEPVLIEWLHRRERTYRYIVYEADSTLTPWSERCLSQADQVLVVADGASRPRDSAFDAALGSMGDSTQTELVLLQPEGIRQPSGTAAWLAHYSAVAHHHVRLGRRADLDRLARHLSGRAVGLVLGGGGARGFAHMGAFRALDEAGITVDIVGGTSMGAILSGSFAMGLGYTAHMALARKLSSPVRLFDPTVPVVSFFESGKVTAALEGIYGDTQIEDLWLPCFCVSSNLTHAIPMVHRQGSLWQAVRASMAIPGVFSPILYDGDLLVDGCVLNNLPIDVMQRLNRGGPIIAINVFPDVDMVKDYRFGPSVSGWGALVGRLSHLAGAGGPPLIFESLLRVLALNDVHQAKTKRAFADVYIRPPVERFNILDFGAYAEIAEIGYHCAQEALAQWQTKPQRAATTEKGAMSASLLEALDELDAALERFGAAH